MFSTHIGICLTNLLGCLFKATLGLLDAAVALPYILLHVKIVLPFEVPYAFLLRRRLLVLGLQRFVVDARAGAEVLLRVGKEIVGAMADEIGFADLGIGDAELGCALVKASHGPRAHELLCYMLADVVGAI